MAAAFRKKYCLNTDLFTYTVPDPYTPKATVIFWVEFLRKELERVFAEYLQLPRFLLTVALYPNLNQQGKDAEDEIYDLTRRLYPDLKRFQP